MLHPLSLPGPRSPPPGGEGEAAGTYGAEGLRPPAPEFGRGPAPELKLSKIIDLNFDFNVFSSRCK